MDELQTYLGIHSNFPYSCRLRGQEDGGWKGNKAWQGTIEFHCTVEGGKVVPTFVSLSFPGLAETAGKNLKLVSMTFPESSADRKEMSVNVKTPSGGEAHFGVQFHHDAISYLVSFVRDSLGKLAPTSALIEKATTKENATPLFINPLDALRPVRPEDSNHAMVGKVADFAAGGGKLKEEAAVVDYKPSLDDQKLITFWEQMLGRGDVVGDPIVARTAAVALIRTALREPGRIVPLAAVWGLSRGLLHGTIQSILVCSGLWRFAKNSEHTICFSKPEGATDIYDWGRLCELWLAPVESLNIEVHKLPEASVTNIPGDKTTSAAFKDALNLCRRLDDARPMAHHAATPREPSAK